MKSYTDLEQSKKLAEILPLESADMHYVLIDTEKNIYSEGLGHYIGILPSIHCWSLAALLEHLDDTITDENGNDYLLEMHKELDGKYCLSYHDRWGYVDGLESDYHDEMVDACVELIVKLKEKNLL